MSGISAGEGAAKGLKERSWRLLDDNLWPSWEKGTLSWCPHIPATDRETEKLKLERENATTGVIAAVLKFESEKLQIEKERYK